MLAYVLLGLRLLLFSLCLSSEAQELARPPAQAHGTGARAWAPLPDIGADDPGMAPSTEAIAGKGKSSPNFTKKGKSIVKEKNAAKNDGKLICENCKTETVPGQKHVKGTTPPSNEAHVDHVIPKAQGGKGDPSNGQVLCRDCNIEKSDKPR